MTKIYLLIPVLIFSFLNTSFAQEEDENCLEPKKKVLKYIIAAVNAKDARTAVENFNNAIEEDPGNATAYYEYGMYAYNKALELKYLIPYYSYYQAVQLRTFYHHVSS